MHPSLNAEFIPPPPLEPKKEMGRNKPCWCGSGMKWKKCHKDRHLQEEFPIGLLISETSKNQKHGQCLHPEASDHNCSNKLVKAHTVQKAGGLAAIAVDGHVISSKKGFENINKNNGKIIPDLLGLTNASTFMGFCSLHDNSLFEPIESKKFTLDHEAAFLFAFRALAYEFLTKRNSIKTIEMQRQMDKGKDFETQIMIQQFIHAQYIGSLKGMSDLKNWKETYDQNFVEKSYTSMPHYAIQFESVLPFVCSGAFHPEVDFNGKRLQIISRGNAEFEHICINITSVGAHSYLVMGWNGIKKGPAEQFVQSFKSVSNKEKSNAALMLAVEQSENTYFNPTWWNELSTVHRNHLIQRMQSGTGINSMRPDITYKNLLKLIPPSNILVEFGGL